MVKAKNKGGRPTKYRKEMLPKIIELMKEGASKVEVCAMLEINNDTLCEWAKVGGDYYIKEFSETLKKGSALSAAWWEKHGRMNLENNQFNYTGWYMNMKNRFGWRDKTEHSGDSNAPIQIISNVPSKK